MTDNSEYLKLITSEHYNKPNYKSYVRSFLDLCSPIEEVLEEFNSLFNLEEAVGDQLDKIGSIINISRTLPIDVQDVPSVLSDDTYRLVIKAKILRDHWDGTRKNIDEIVTAIFPDISYDIVDNQNMTISINVIDPNSTAEQRALILAGYVFPKPSGVEVVYNISTSPLFGWDRDTDIVGGFDESIWSSI